MGIQAFLRRTSYAFHAGPNPHERGLNRPCNSTAAAIFLAPTISDDITTGRQPYQSVHLGDDSANRDPGLACLVTIAYFHGIPADPDRLVHQIGRNSGNFAESDILLAARSLSLKAAANYLRRERLSRMPLPALILDRQGRHFILAGVSDDGTALIQEGGDARSSIIQQDEVMNRSQGRAIIAAQLRRYVAFDQHGADVKLNNLMVPSASSRELVDSIIGISSAELGNEEIAALRPRIYDFASTRVKAGKRLFLKTHDAYGPVSDEIAVPVLGRSIDRILYLIRDPREVAPSLSRHLGLSIDEAIAVMADPAYRLSEYPWRPGKHIGHLISSWSGHVKSWVGRSEGPPICVTRYEDMVAAPHETFANMMRFLNVTLPVNAVSIGVAATQMSILQRKEAEKLWINLVI
jgi:aryl sulfotransferase